MATSLPAESADTGWTEARRLVNQLTPFPSLILDPVRMLWEAHKLGFSEPDEDSIRVARAVVKSPKLRAPITFAAKGLAPEVFEEHKEKESAQILLHALGPGLCAVLLFFIFLHRRVAKLASGEDWEKLVADLLLNMELGYAVGQASQLLGRVDGMLLGGIRHLAIATFMLDSSAEYHKYRLRGSKKFDLDFERGTWGCDHSQVAAYLLSDFMFRKDVMEVSAALKKIGKTNANEDLQRWRSALVFIDTLKSGICPPPDASHAERLSISAPAAEGLRAKYLQIRDTGESSFSWMLKTSKDAL